MRAIKMFYLLSILCFCLLFTAKAMADTDVDVHNRNSMETSVQASPSQQINSKSEAQPLQIQELSFIYPAGLFVNASDFRNVMDLLKFIHENPCPYRWQLEKWADGGSVDVIMSTINDGSKKCANDRICIFLDIEDFFWIKARDPKTKELMRDPATRNFIWIKDTENTFYRGAAVGNVKSKTISVQALAKLGLEAIDYGHNALEIRARVIAENVVGDAKGISFGGGGSKISGDVGFTVPAMLGWSKSKTGKIALDGIQSELYERKKGIVFEDEVVKIRKQVEKIWDDQMKTAQEKKEMDKLRAEVEKKNLELKKEQLDRELGKLQNPLPPAPPPVVPPVVQTPPPVILPPVVSKPEAKKIEPCLASLLFEIDDYMPNQGKNASQNFEQAKRQINWLIDNSQEINKQGMKIALIGGCDERLIPPLKKTNEKYSKDVKSLTGGDATLTKLHPYPTDKDYVNPLLGERRARLSKVYLGLVAKQMGAEIFVQVQPILKSIVVLSSVKDWYAVPDKPLDDKNRYAMLAVVIGGPDGK